MTKTTFLVEEVLPSKVSTSASNIKHLQSQDTSYTKKSSCLDDSHRSWTSTENLALTMCPDTLDVIDTYSGLSNSLLLLISEITDVKQEMLCVSRKALSVRRAGETVLLVKAKRIKDSLLNLQQFVPASVASTDPRFGANLKRTAEAYRLAALILLHESLSVPASISTAVPTPRDNLPASVPRDSAVLDINDKTAYIQSVLTLVGEVLTQGAPNCSWPLWPLFIASCCAESEADKIVALNLFEMAQQKMKIGVR